VSLADRLSEVNLHGARVAVIDIERFPNISAHWDRKPNYIPADHTISPSRMSCWAAQWLGEEEIDYRAEYDFDRGEITEQARDDMLLELWTVLDDADAIVGHNIARFDLPHMRTELLLAGLPEPSPVKVIDTYRIVRGRLKLESNSLKYACQLFGLPHKLDSGGMRTTLAAMLGDREAWEQIRTYNRGDITASTALYRHLVGHIPNHPFLGDAPDDAKRCNQCGSDDLRRDGSHRAVVLDYARYVCGSCGAHVRAGWVNRAAVTRGIG
jgi:hypothetical protein